MTVTARTVEIAREDVLRFARMSDAELRRQAALDLKSYLFLAPVLLLTGKTQPGIVRRAFIEYRRLKKGAQRKAGAVLVLPLRYRGGDRICNEYDYCKKKSEFFNSLAGVADNPEVVVVATEMSESLDWLVDVIGELLELIGDAAIPVSFAVLSIKEGLDDLCRCCKDCDGSGFTSAGVTCPTCDGVGHSRAA